MFCHMLEATLSEKINYYQGPDAIQCTFCDLGHDIYLKIYFNIDINDKQHLVYSCIVTSSIVKYSVWMVSEWTTFWKLHTTSMEMQRL